FCLLQPAGLPGISAQPAAGPLVCARFAVRAGFGVHRRTGCTAAVRSPTLGLLVAADMVFWPVGSHHSWFLERRARCHAGDGTAGGHLGSGLPAQLPPLSPAAARDSAGFRDRPPVRNSIVAARALDRRSAPTGCLRVHLENANTQPYASANPVG